MSKIEVNTVDVQCGSTLTLGSSGKTVTLAPGASQSGFGASGAVNWCSTIYTNSPGTVTATSGKGFFLNTTSGAITINLPSSPSVGDIVAIKDYANTFDSNNVTVGRGGSKIAGLCLDATLKTEGESITLIYADSTKGWLNVNTDSTVAANRFVEATGGTILTCGNFKTHVFTASGCFQVTNAGQPCGSNTIDYTIIAGGAGGGQGASPVYMGGAGGAGGFRLSNSVGCIAAPVMSPLANPTGVTVTAQTYPIVVGAGGAKAPGDNQAGNNGNTSSGFSISSAGGGFGAAGAGTPEAGGPGGSGGGSTQGQPAGSGNTPPVSPPQGNNGGVGAPGNTNSGAGGGGAGAVGGSSPSPSIGGTGGIGSFISTDVFGPTAPTYGVAGPVSFTRYFAGGGSGSSNGPSAPGGVPGGIGGGGKGATGGPSIDAGDGTTNTGGGGGGGSGDGTGVGCAGNGGSGIVIIRYKFQ